MCKDIGTQGSVGEEGSSAPHSDIRRKKLIRRAVLALNRNYVPCYITGLKHAFSLLFRESAYVLDSDLNTYTIWEWIEFSDATEEYKGNGRNGDYMNDGGDDGVNYDVDYDNEYIFTVSRKIRVPRIIIVNTDVGPRMNRPKVSRLGIFIRDGFRCQYCGKKLSYKNLTIDHVIPKSKGGKTEWTNVVTSCMPCNSKKGDRTPKAAGMTLIREPRIPSINILYAREIDIKFYPEWEPYIVG